MQKIKRHTYLVNKGVQMRYMGLAVIPLVILLTALYYLIYYSVFNEMLIPEAVATTLLPAMKKVNAVVLVFAPVALWLIVRATLVYSNRIIGPVPRLERQLEKAIAGDYSVRIKARTHDELAGLVDKINVLLEKIDMQGRAKV
jgi:signal transduction histidine kinase